MNITNQIISLNPFPFIQHLNPQSGTAVIRDLLRNEGAGAFFKGLTPKVRLIMVYIILNWFNDSIDWRVLTALCSSLPPFFASFLLPPISPSSPLLYSLFYDLFLPPFPSLR